MRQDWRPQGQQTRLAPRFNVAPGGTGISGLRTGYGQPLFVLLGIVALGAAHRLCQHGQLAGAIDGRRGRGDVRQRGRLAGYVPARRAARVDPMVAWREQ